MVAKASMQQTESKLIADLELLGRELLSAQDEANRQAYHVQSMRGQNYHYLCIRFHMDSQSNFKPFYFLCVSGHDGSSISTDQV